MRIHPARLRFLPGSLDDVFARVDGALGGRGVRGRVRGGGGGGGRGDGAAAEGGGARGQQTTPRPGGEPGGRPGSRAGATEARFRDARGRARRRRRRRGTRERRSDFVDRRRRRDAVDRGRTPSVAAGLVFAFARLLLLLLLPRLVGLPGRWTPTPRLCAWAGSGARTRTPGRRPRRRRRRGRTGCRRLASSRGRRWREPWRRRRSVFPARRRVRVRGVRRARRSRPAELRGAAHEADHGGGG